MTRTARTRILGIDPGLRHTGWGMIEIEGSAPLLCRLRRVEPSPKADFADRLAAIHEGLRVVILDHAPDEAAVEETFVNKDARATLKLGAARGIALLVPAQAGLTVAEYAPNQVKKSVVGAGHAEKAQIRLMVKVLLPKAEFRHR